jgi:hypothetical protein
MDWLVAVVLFWFAAAIYFGGYERDVAGGSGVRQLVGLLVTYAIFLGVWRLIEGFVGTETALGIIVASVAAGLLLPLEARLGFLVVGGRITHQTGH